MPLTDFNLKEFSLAEIKTAFADLISEHTASQDRKFAGVSSVENIKDGSLVFCSKTQFIESTLHSRAGGIVVDLKMYPDVVARAQNKVVIASNNPEFLMAQVLQLFVLPTPHREDWYAVGANCRHPSAVIHESAEIDPSAVIGPHVVIGREVKIAAGVYVGANSVIESFSEIGEQTTIQPLVVIGSRVRIGSRCEISAHTIIGKEGFGYAHDNKGNHLRIAHQGWVVIEDDVHIGASNTIDRGTFDETRIGQGTKTDNQVHIAHNCKVGRGCLLTSGLKMAGSSSIGNFVITGGDTLISGHIHVTDHVHLAAQSGVSKAITVAGDYGGSPLVPLQTFLKNKAAMAHLHDMRKQLDRLMNKIFPEG